MTHCDSAKGRDYGSPALDIQQAVLNHKKEFKQELKAAYEDYITNVSQADMAASLEANTYIMTLCQVLQPKRVLELGSGFSSYALRLQRDRRMPEMAITSVDTERLWLDKSESFCKKHDLEGGEYLLWDELAARPSQFDFIFLDMADATMRKAVFRQLLTEYCARGGAILVDDLHWPKYRHFVLETMAEGDFCFINSKKYTLDSFGRFEGLFIRQG